MDDEVLVCYCFVLDWEIATTQDDNDESDDQIIISRVEMDECVIFNDTDCDTCLTRGGMSVGKLNFKCFWCDASKECKEFHISVDIFSSEVACPYFKYNYGFCHLDALAAIIIIGVVSLFVLIFLCVIVIVIVICWKLKKRRAKAEKQKQAKLRMIRARKMRAMQAQQAQMKARARRAQQAHHRRPWKQPRRRRSSSLPPRRRQKSAYYSRRRRSSSFPPRRRQSSSVTGFTSCIPIWPFGKSSSRSRGDRSNYRDRSPPSRSSYDSYDDRRGRGRTPQRGGRHQGASRGRPQSKGRGRETRPKARHRRSVSWSSGSASSSAATTMASSSFDLNLDDSDDY